MKLIKDRIAAYKAKYENFISNIRQAFDEQAHEHQNDYHGAFNTLLLLATYAPAAELETEFEKCLPENYNVSLKAMCQQLREINGVCNTTLGDNHQIYQALFDGLKTLDIDQKAIWYELLAKEVTEMITESVDNNHRFIL